MITAAKSLPKVAAAVALSGLALASVGCGKVGRLEQPAPLYGEHARIQYEAQKKKAAEAKAAKGAATTGPAAADTPDDAPLTTRDIKAPEQKPVPASQAPIDGIPNPLGNSVSTRAPG